MVSVGEGVITISVEVTRKHDASKLKVTASLGINKSAAIGNRVGNRNGVIVNHEINKSEVTGNRGASKSGATVNHEISKSIVIGSRVGNRNGVTVDQAGTATMTTTITVAFTHSAIRFHFIWAMEEREITGSGEAVRLTRETT